MPSGAQHERLAQQEQKKYKQTGIKSGIANEQVQAAEC